MIIFVAIKYLSLVINAARSLLLASLLGPESYGLLGSLVIVQQYLSYTTLGMREGITIKLTETNGHYRKILQDSAIIWGLGVGCLVLLAMSILVQIDRLRDEWFWVGMISMFSIVNEIIINIHRDEGNLNNIALLEIIYASMPLGCAFWFGKDITVTLVLQSMIVGLACSVLGLLWGLTGIRIHNIKFSAIYSLMKSGFPLAISGFFPGAITSMYVLLANQLHSKTEIGVIAFANNITIIVLYGSNVIAWASTSKSMRAVAIDTQLRDELHSNQTLAYFFRFAILVSVSAIAFTATFVTQLMPTYVGMERYATLFCLLQANILMLYVELNYLAVCGRSASVAKVYALMFAVVLAVWKYSTGVEIHMLISLGIGLSSIAGVICATYCERLGLKSVSLRSQYFFLTFPTLAAAALYVFGTPAAGYIACVFLVYVLIDPKWRIVFDFLR